MWLIFRFNAQLLTRGLAAKESLMTQVSETSPETVEQPETTEQETPETQPSTEESESSDQSSTENSAQEPETPAEETPGSVDDYVGSESTVSESETPALTDWEKRYKDSSREAQQIKARLDALDKVISDDPELYDVVQQRLTGVRPTESHPPTTPSATNVPDDMVKDLQWLKRERENEVVQRFERGKTITPAMREAMKPHVTKLKELYPLAEALQMAYARVANVSQQSVEQAKATALAQKHLNDQATYATSNPKPATKSGEPALVLTDKEREYIRKIGGFDENGKLRPSYAAQLMQTRKNQQ